MRYEVTVNRDHIDKKIARSIRVTDTKTGAWEDFEAIQIVGDSVIQHGPPRSNGATVWVECGRYRPLRP